MSRQPRIFLRHRLYELCFRAEEGLPLVCTPYMQVIFKGILARALTLYDTTLCHCVVMGNHIHMDAIVDDPEHLHRFVLYLKRELSHAINNLLGRQRHTVWQAEYQAVPILDAAKAIERIAYLYLNPARAHLVEHIEDYPNFSTWDMLKAGFGRLTAKRIPRNVIPALPKYELTLAEQRQLAAELLQQAEEEYSVVIQPDAWLSCVTDGQDQDPEIVHEIILNAVRLEESRLKSTREFPVIGQEKLRRENIRKEHAPAKFGERMSCFASTIAHRKPFIEWVKQQCQRRLLLKKLLLPFEFIQQLPPGFFAPGGRLRANLNPHLLPI